MNENDQTQQSGNSSQPPTGASGENWEARYKGMNSLYQTTVGTYEGLKTQLEAQLKAEQAKAKATEETAQKLMSDVEKYSKQQEEQQKQLADLSVQAATAKKELERTKLFLSPDYIHLAQYEQQGLLRKDIEGEELANYLKSFDQVVKGAGVNNVTNLMSGSTPPVPSGGSVDGQALWEQAKAKFANKDVAGYNELMNQYYKQMQKDPKAKS